MEIDEGVRQQLLDKKKMKSFIKVLLPACELLLFFKTYFEFITDKTLHAYIVYYVLDKSMGLIRELMPAHFCTTLKFGEFFRYSDGTKNYLII